jgi:hypothetical protein
MLKNFCCFESYGTASTTTLKINNQQILLNDNNDPDENHQLIKKKFIIEKKQQKGMKNQDACDMMLLTGSENSNYEETAKLCSNTSFDQNAFLNNSSSCSSNNQNNNVMATNSIHFYHPKSIQNSITRNNTFTSQNLTVITPTPLSANTNTINQVLNDSLEQSSISNLTYSSNSHKQHFNSILSSFKNNIQKHQEKEQSGFKRTNSLDKIKKKFIDEIYLDQQKLITNMPSLSYTSSTELKDKISKNNLVDTYESINSSNDNLVKSKIKKQDWESETKSVKMTNEIKLSKQHIISSVTLNNGEEAVANVHETYNNSGQEIAYMTQQTNKVKELAANKNENINRYYENCSMNNNFEKKRVQHRNYSKEKKTGTKSTQLVILLNENKTIEKDSKTKNDVTKTKTKTGCCNLKLDDHNSQKTKVAKIAKSKLSSTPILISQSGSYNITKVNDALKKSSASNKLKTISNSSNSNHSKQTESILSSSSNHQIKLNKIKFKNHNYIDSSLINHNTNTNRKISFNTKASGK